MNKRIKVILICLLVIFLSQTFLFNSAYIEYRDYKSNFTDLEKNSKKYDGVLLDKIIRPQQRYMLSAIRQSWIQSSEDSITSLLKTIDDKIIYCNDRESIKFCEEEMKLKRISDNKFNIYDNYGNLMLNNASPQWNDENILKILNTIMSPLKPFGNKGGFLVIDSYNGNVIVDTTSNKRLKETVNYNIYRDLDTTLYPNKNVVNSAIDGFLERKDSDNFSQYIYLKNEKVLLDDPNDFSRYPLGQYHRQFIEKIILPYEMIGVEGQPMQLTILAVVDEQDISKDYSSLKNDNENIQKVLYNNIGHMANLIVYLMALSTIMIIICIAVVIIKEKDKK